MCRSLAAITTQPKNHDFRENEFQRSPRCDLQRNIKMSNSFSELYEYCLLFLCQWLEKLQIFQIFKHNYYHKKKKKKKWRNVSIYMQYKDSSVPNYSSNIIVSDCMRTIDTFSALSIIAPCQ